MVRGDTVSAGGIETERLKLIPKTREDVRAMIESMSPGDRAELSADWLALVENATSDDPWVFGFKTRGHLVRFLAPHL